MRRSAYLSLALILVLTLLVVEAKPAEAQKTPAGKPKSKVITPEERRAQWIKGAKKEGALDWWGTGDIAEAERIAAEFNKKYPFVKVEFWRGSIKEITSKLDAEMAVGRYSVDIIHGADPIMVPRWTAKGVLEKFTEIIPGIEKWDKRTYTPESAMIGNNIVSIHYNTKQVSPAEAPKNWEDLLDPKWKGHLGLTRDMHFWVTFALAEGGWGLDKTVNFLTKLKEQKPRIAKSMSEAHTLLTSGEFKVQVTGFDRHLNLALRKKAPLEWVRCRPVIITGPKFIIPKGALHPNAAKLFLEWLLSPEGLKVVEKVMLYGHIHNPATVVGATIAKEKLPLLVQTEQTLIKGAELGLEKKFLQILGIL